MAKILNNITEALAFFISQDLIMPPNNNRVETSLLEKVSKNTSLVSKKIVVGAITFHLIST